MDKKVPDKVSDSSPLSKEKLNVFLTLSFSPSGHLYLYSEPETFETLSHAAAEKIKSFFSFSDAVGLLRLGLTHFTEPLPPSFAYWQQFAQLFITAMCKSTHSNDPLLPQVPFPHAEAALLINQAPFMRGSEYLTVETVSELWQRLASALADEVAFGSLEKRMLTRSPTF